MPNTYRPTLSQSSDALRAKSFSVSLHSRFIGRGDSLQGPSWAMILIEEGLARISTQSGDLDVSGPALLCLPWQDTARLAIRPGTAGVFLNLSSATLQSTVGYRAESNELRRLFERRVQRNLSGDPELLTMLSDFLHALTDEIAEDAAAARTAAEAYLRIALIRVWRSLTDDLAPLRPASPQVDLYNRFIALIEHRFRERWGVGDYARALRISRDRLGDICRNASGRSPKQAIDARMAIEAKLLIEHSTGSIEQIAEQLGFPSASHFTRFFARTTGVAPSRYRSAHMWEAPQVRPQSAMHEWP